MLEKDMENLIACYPDEFFPKSELKLIGQQVQLGSCYADIIFKDRYERTVIVEVKRGLLSREASGQIMEYYGLLKQQKSNETIELILCANSIPHERKEFLEKVGIECKVIGIENFESVAKKYKFIANEAEKAVLNIDVAKRPVNLVKAGDYQMRPKTQDEFYQKFLQKSNRSGNRSFLIKKLLEKGSIKEGRINFTRLLEGGTLGRTERSGLEKCGFTFSEIVFAISKSGKINKKRIVEATLTKTQVVRGYNTNLQEK